jgi:hypothetical protein
MATHDIRADAQSAARARTPSYTDTPGMGLVSFAVIMLGLAGTFNVIEGLLAIAESRVYVGDSTFVFSDLNTWGWIITLLGALQLIAAFTIVSGSEWGRWLGVGAAFVNSIGQLFFMPAYPLWSITMFAVDLLIIYALVAYGGKQLRSERL